VPVRDDGAPVDEEINCDSFARGVKQFTRQVETMLEMEHEDAGKFLKAFILHRLDFSVNSTEEEIESELEQRFSDTEQLRKDEEAQLAIYQDLLRRCLAGEKNL
jgi:hypothetical protein